MRENPKAHEVYTHFKGNKYQVITLAQDAETEETLVVYKPMYGEEKAYVRTLSNFLEEVDHDKYPQIEQKFRFEKEYDTNEEQLDPLVLEFLDAKTYEDRLNIIVALHHRLTDDMINTMAIAMDIEVNNGTLEERYLELKNGISMHEKFEGNRLR